MVGNGRRSPGPPSMPRPTDYHERDRTSCLRLWSEVNPPRILQAGLIYIAASGSKVRLAKNAEGVLMVVKFFLLLLEHQHAAVGFFADVQIPFTVESYPP